MNKKEEGEAGKLTSTKCGDLVSSRVALRAFVVATTGKACVLVAAVCRAAFSVVSVSSNLDNLVLGSSSCYCSTRHETSIVICRPLVYGSVEECGSLNMMRICLARDILAD